MSTYRYRFTYLCLLSYCTYGQGATDAPPIGAVFQEGKSGPLEAFSDQIEYLTKARDQIGLINDYNVIDMADAYKVTASVCKLISKGVFALFGGHHSNTIGLMQSLSKTLNMPLITSGPAVNNTEQQLGYDIFMRPLYTHAVVDLIQVRNWAHLFFIYDSHDGITRLQQLLEVIISEGLDVTLNHARINDPDAALIQLKEWQKLYIDEQKTLLVDLQRQPNEELFRSLKTYDDRVDFDYFLVELDMIMELDLSQYKDGGLSITGFTLTYDELEPDERLHVNDRLSRDPRVGDYRFEDALAADAATLIARALTEVVEKDRDGVSEALSQTAFYGGDTPLIDCYKDPTQSWKYGPDIIQALKQVEFDGLTGHVSFDQFGLRKDYLLGVYGITKKSGRSKMGSWSSKSGLEIKLVSNIPSSPGRGNKIYIVTSILSPPFLMLKPSLHGEELSGNDRYEGYCADLIRHLARFIGFSYEIQLVNDGRFGSRNENGTWDGMMGELIHGEADLAVAPLSITSTRQRMVDFTKPFMSYGLGVLMAEPPKHIPSPFWFFEVFSYEIWIAIVIAYFIVSVTASVVGRNLLDTMWFTAGGLLRQQSKIYPKSISVRILAGTWWAFSTFFALAYLSGIIGFLTAENQSADDQTVKFIVLKDGSTEASIKTSASWPHDRMWSFISSSEPSVFVETNEQGIEKVRQNKGKYGYLMETPMLTYINQKAPCDTMKVGEIKRGESLGYGIATPLGSPLRDQLTLAALELGEIGLLLRLQHKWWNEMGECGKASPSRDVGGSLGLQSIIGLVYILLSGLAIALVVVLLELLIKSCIDAGRKKVACCQEMCFKCKLVWCYCKKTNREENKETKQKEDIKD